MSNTHGGKREGAGRKQRDTKQLSIKVPTDLIERLNKKFKIVRERNIKIIEALEKLSK